MRMLKYYWQLPFVVLALLEFGALLGSVYWTGRMLRPWIDPALHLLPSFFTAATIFAAVQFLMMTIMGLYHPRQRMQSMELLQRIVVAQLFGLGVLQLGNLLFTYLHPYPHYLLSIATVIAIVFVAAIRFFFMPLFNEDLFKRNVLIYGAGKQAGSIAQLRRRADRRGFNVIGYVPTEGDAYEPLVADQCVEITHTLLHYCRVHTVDEIVVAMDDRRRNFPMEQLLECRLAGVRIVDLLTFLERETGKVRLDVIHPSWMVFSEGYRHGRFYMLLERIFDIVVSLSLLLLSLPVMLMVMVAIKIESGLFTPVIYTQVRVGKGGRLFRLLKLRSMHVNAEQDGKAIWASKNDVRITRVGSLIRKTRIDELPQVVNVFKGEMSFVGPRPERPEFVSQLNDRVPYYHERHTIKPGITGWAQVCFPYGASEEDAIEKLQCDLYYVKNHSPVFYWAILLQTLEVVLWRKGAR